MRAIARCTPGLDDRRAELLDLFVFSGEPVSCGRPIRACRVKGADAMPALICTPKDDTPVIFEYIEDASNVNGFVLKPMSAAEAFRRFNWLKMEPVMNKSGNLRGMVINKNMRTVFQVSKNVGNKLAVVSALIEMGKEWSRAKTVYNSTMDPIEKYARITNLFGAAILRSVTSVVPTAVELSALSLSGYSGLYSELTGDPSGHAFGQKAKDFARNIRTIHSRQWDGENWYNVIESLAD
jgi:hypothetical protein